MTTKAVNGTHVKQNGENRGCANHNHDLLRDLSRRLGALRRYARFVAHAEGRPELQACWRDLKSQEAENIKRLKSLIVDEIMDGCF